MSTHTDMIFYQWKSLEETIKLCTHVPTISRDTVGYIGCCYRCKLHVHADTTEEVQKKWNLKLEIEWLRVLWGD